MVKDNFFRVYENREPLEPESEGEITYWVDGNKFTYVENPDDVYKINENYTIGTWLRVSDDDMKRAYQKMAIAWRNTGFRFVLFDYNVLYMDTWVFLHNEALTPKYVQVELNDQGDLTYTVPLLKLMLVTHGTGQLTDVKVPVEIYSTAFASFAEPHLEPGQQLDEAIFDYIANNIRDSSNDGYFSETLFEEDTSDATIGTVSKIAYKLPSGSNELDSSINLSQDDIAFSVGYNVVVMNRSYGIQAAGSTDSNLSERVYSIDGYSMMTDSNIPDYSDSNNYLEEFAKGVSLVGRMLLPNELNKRYLDMNGITDDSFATIHLNKTDGDFVNLKILNENPQISEPDGQGVRYLDFEYFVSTSVQTNLKTIEYKVALLTNTLYLELANTPLKLTTFASNLQKLGVNDEKFYTFVDQKTLLSSSSESSNSNVYHVVLNDTDYKQHTTQDGTTYILSSYYADASLGVNEFKKVFTTINGDVADVDDLQSYKLAVIYIKPVIGEDQFSQRLAIDGLNIEQSKSIAAVASSNNHFDSPETDLNLLKYTLDFTIYDEVATPLYAYTVATKEKILNAGNLVTDYFIYDSLIENYERFTLQSSYAYAYDAVNNPNAPNDWSGGYGYVGNSYGFNYGFYHNYPQLATSEFSNLNVHLPGGKFILYPSQDKIHIDIAGTNPDGTNNYHNYSKTLYAFCDWNNSNIRNPDKHIGIWSTNKTYATQNLNGVYEFSLPKEINMFRVIAVKKLTSTSDSSYTYSAYDGIPGQIDVEYYNGSIYEPVTGMNESSFVPVIMNTQDTLDTDFEYYLMDFKFDLVTTNKIKFKLYYRTGSQYIAIKHFSFWKREVQTAMEISTIQYNLEPGPLERKSSFAYAETGESSINGWIGYHNGFVYPTVYNNTEFDAGEITVSPFYSILYPSNDKVYTSIEVNHENHIINAFCDWDNPTISGYTPSGIGTYTTYTTQTIVVYEFNNGPTAIDTITIVGYAQVPRRPSDFITIKYYDNTSGSYVLVENQSPNASTSFTSQSSTINTYDEYLDYTFTSVTSNKFKIIMTNSSTNYISIRHISLKSQTKVLGESRSSLTHQHKLAPLETNAEGEDVYGTVAAGSNYSISYDVPVVYNANSNVAGDDVYIDYSLLKDTYVYTIITEATDLSTIADNAYLINETIDSKGDAEGNFVGLKISAVEEADSNVATHDLNVTYYAAFKHTTQQTDFKVAFIEYALYQSYFEDETLSDLFDKISSVGTTVDESTSGENIIEGSAINVEDGVIYSDIVTTVINVNVYNTNNIISRPIDAYQSYKMILKYRDVYSVAQDVQRDITITNYSNPVYSMSADYETESISVSIDVSFMGGDNATYYMYTLAFTGAHAESNVYDALNNFNAVHPDGTALVSTDITAVGTTSNTIQANDMIHDYDSADVTGSNIDLFPYTLLKNVYIYTIISTTNDPTLIDESNSFMHECHYVNTTNYVNTFVENVSSPFNGTLSATIHINNQESSSTRTYYLGIFMQSFLEQFLQSYTDSDYLSLMNNLTYANSIHKINVSSSEPLTILTYAFTITQGIYFEGGSIIQQNIQNDGIIKIIVTDGSGLIIPEYSSSLIIDARLIHKFVELPLQYEYGNEDGTLSNPEQFISNTYHTSINGQTMGEPIYFVKDSLANFGAGTNYYPNGTDKPFVIVTDAGTGIDNLKVTLDAPGTYLYTADLCINSLVTYMTYYNQIEGWLESSSNNGTTWNEILGTYGTIQLGRNQYPRYFRFVRMIEMTSSSLWVRPVLRTHLMNTGSSKANTGAIGSPQRTILTHARVSTRAIDTSLPYVNVKSRGNSTALRGKSPVYHADVNAYPYKRQVMSGGGQLDVHQELDLSPIDGMNHYDDLGTVTSSLIRYTNTTGSPTFAIEAAGDATPGSPQRVTFKQGGKYLVHLNMHVTVAGPYDSIVSHLNSQYIIQVYLFNPSGNGGQGTYTSIMMDLDRMSKYDGSGTADDCTNQHSYDVLIDIPEGDTNCQLIVYANVDHWYWSERTQYFAITLLEYNITMLPSVGYTQLQGKSGMTVFNGNADDDLITPTGAEYGTSLAVSISNYDENNLEFVGTTINNGDMSIDVGTPSNINVLNAGNYNIKLHGILDLKTTATAASQELISKYGGVVLTLVVYNNDGSVKSDNVRELMSNMYPSTKNEKYKRTYTNKTTAPAISLVQQAYALHVMINFEVQDIVLEAGEYIRFHVSMFRNNPWNKVTTVTMVSNDFSEDTSSLIIKKQ